MSSPPTIPVTNQQAAQPHPPTNTPAFRTFFSRLSASLRDGLSQRRPWSELIDRTSMARPESLTDALSRIRKNLAYFKVNYAAVVSLFSHPLSLLVLLALLAAWMFLYVFRPADQPLVVFGRGFSDWETLLGLGLCTVVVVFMTSVGSLLTSGLMVGVAVVCLHGAFVVTDDWMIIIWSLLTRGCSRSLVVLLPRGEFEICFRRGGGFDVGHDPFALIVLIIVAFTYDVAFGFG